MIAGRLIAIGGKAPRVHESAFVAPGAILIGDVEIGPEASIWYNSVLRAEVNRIVVGARSNIQDGSIIHCDPPTPDRPDGFPTLIGDDVLIGHMAMVHGCTLLDRAFVGLGAVAMNGAVVEGDAMLAAGAMLTPGKRVPTGELWSGRPARLQRTLAQRELEGMRAGVAHYVENGRRHAEALMQEREARLRS